MKDINKKDEWPRRKASEKKMKEERKREKRKVKMPEEKNSPNKINLCLFW